MTNRRSFLRGALALTAVAALPVGVLAESLPLLTADGIADDTDALNAMVRGLPFRTADGFTGKAEQALLEGATIRINGTLDINFSSALQIRKCNIRVRPPEDGRCNIEVRNNSVLNVSDSTFHLESAKYKWPFFCATNGGQVLTGDVMLDEAINVKAGA